MASINRMASRTGVTQTPRTATSAIVASCNDYKQDSLSARAI
jgi:hypothetical protein